VQVKAALAALRDGEILQDPRKQAEHMAVPTTPQSNDSISVTIVSKAALRLVTNFKAAHVEHFFNKEHYVAALGSLFA
jgi:hypothetical protein